MMIAPRVLLRSLFDAAIAAADPARVLAPHLPPPPHGRTIVVGAGKAAASMAAAFERTWPGNFSGLVVTRYGHKTPTRTIEVIEAGHPVPDAAGLAGSRRILAMVENLGPEDLVICLLSGGASALLPLPLAGLSLQDEVDVGRALLKSGATIAEMNCVRRHLSGIKGGRLACACHPAQVVTLAISDVPGDDPVDIGSGPTVADPTSSADALAITVRYGMAIPDKIGAILGSGTNESIKPGDPRLARAEVRMIATPLMALEAAAALAREQGVAAHILSDRIEGEARDVGKVLAALARHVADHREPFAPPCVLLSGGETTVTVRGRGRGGRNVEFLLSLALALDGHARIHALAGDTDGVDGLADIAGAIMTPDTLARARALGLNPHESLAANDGHGFFQALGDSVITGPTLTNVNDFRAILIEVDEAGVLN
ncbi:MAG: glycerate kinase [Beijerinckiaceae bacterium]